MLLPLCCPVSVHHESAGGKAVQTDPPGHQQERVQLHAPGLLLALHAATPQHLQGQADERHRVSTCSSGGTERDLRPESQTGASLHLLYHVQVLDLSNNRLKDFYLVLPALRELHLSGNKFLRLPPGGLFPNLQTLTIQVGTNHISRFFFQSLFPPV